MNKVIHDDSASIIESLDISTLGFLLKLVAHLPHHPAQRTYGELAHVAGCSRNTAQRHVATLEASGLLAVHRQRIDRSRYATNTYQLTQAAQKLGTLFVQNLGDAAQNLGDGVQNLGGESVDSFNVVVGVVINENNNPLEMPLNLESAGTQSLNADGSDTPPVNPASWALLQSVGVRDNQTARQLATYPPEQVKAAINYARPKATRNFAGYALDALRAGYALTPPPAAKPELPGDVSSASVVNKLIHKKPQAVPEPHPEELPTEPELLPAEDETESDINLSALNKLIQRSQPPALLYDKPETREADAWRGAYNQLALQFDRATFDTWLREAVFLNYADGVFEIGVPNSYARDMCQHRLYRNIRRVVQDVYRSPVELQFSLHTPAPQPEPEIPLFKRLALEQFQEAQR